MLGQLLHSHSSNVRPESAIRREYLPAGQVTPKPEVALRWLVILTAPACVNSLWKKLSTHSPGWIAGGARRSH